MSFTARLRGACIAFAFALVPGLAAAQITTQVVDARPAGLDLPVTSGAVEDDAAASVVNPAGLGFLRGLSLRYAHEQALEDHLEGDGVYLGAPMFGPLALGFAAEWVRPAPTQALLAGRAGEDVRRISWGLAIGSDAAAIGGALHFHDAQRGVLDDVTTGDLGLIVRPARFASLGFAARDLNAPDLDGGGTLPRRYLASLGLRPFGERLTLSADAEVLGGESTTPGGLEHAALGYGAALEAIRGVSLLGGFAHRVDGGDTVVQAGLALDFEHVGVGAAVARRRGGSTGVIAGVRASSADLRGIELEPRAQVAVVDLGDALARPGGLVLFPGPARDPMLDAVTGLARLAADPRIDAVVLKVDLLEDLAWGSAYELRQAILEFRRSGKKLYVLLSGAQDAEYYLASAGDGIWADREATLLVNGLSASASFFADTLDMIGVHAEAIRVGDYKNAPDALTRSSISEAQQEVLEAILDGTFRHYLSETAKARKMSEEQLRKILDTGVVSAKAGKDLGLVDELVYQDEVEDALKRALGRSARTFEARLRPEGFEGWGDPPVIALIPVDAVIASGESERDPFGLVETSGAKTIIQELERAAEDPKVKAIVLRVDSPGGDAHASDLIWHAVAKAREKKPVVASMGDVAASGGYYVAAPADRIFAAPTTLTGSIGVFVLKPNIEELLSFLKVGRFEASRGANARLLDLTGPWSDTERAALQAYIDAAYGRFVEIVAEGRKLKASEVDAVARGRVWLGAQALEKKLVDELGGLGDALADARRRGGIAPGAPVEYRVYRPSLALLALDSDSQVRVTLPGSVLPAPVRAALRQGVPPALLVRNPSAVWALPEWQVHVR